MTANVRTQADRKAALAAAPVYVYQFAMEQGARGGKLEVPHTAEIAYLFDNLALSSALLVNVTDEHLALADYMIAAWAAFARDGRPQLAGMPAWPAYTVATRSVMVLDDRMRVAFAPRTDELAAIGALKSAG